MSRKLGVPTLGAIALGLWTTMVPGADAPPTTSSPVERPARTWQVPHLVIICNDINLDVAVNGLPLRSVRGETTNHGGEYATLYHEGENVVTVRWSPADGKQDAGKTPSARVKVNLVTRRESDKAVGGDLVTSEALAQWELKAGADGIVPGSGEARITFRLDGYPLKQLPWETNKERGFGEADRADIMALVKELGAAYEKKDFDALKKFDEFREKLRQTAFGTLDILGNKQMEAFTAKLGEMVKGPEWQPIPFDEKSVVIERIEGVNLVHVRGARTSQPFVGLTNGKQTFGFQAFFLSLVDGKWVRVR